MEPKYIKFQSGLIGRGKACSKTDVSGAMTVFSTFNLNICPEMVIMRSLIMLGIR
jgi:hypothetical protein